MDELDIDNLIEEMEARREAMERARAAGDPLAYDKAAKGLQNFLKVGFDEMSDLRHEIALKKAPYVVEFVRDQLAAGVNKVVVMAHHRDVQDAMVKAFSKELGPEAVVLHRGGVHDADKQAAVDRFQSDPTARVFVGSILASGVGITLTAAAVVVFAELDWVPLNMAQAEDRCYRIGQTLPVMVYHLVVDGTLDAKMVDFLIRKQEIADSALDTERAAPWTV
jgi:SWI/SNF-related matrix-associated actin-dependent regulator 1 of chromatin subfamily A